MTNNQIKYMIEIAKTGSINQAAKTSSSHNLL